MKQLYITISLACLLLCPATAQNEADRAVATLIADLAQISKEKASFMSIKCDRTMLAQFNITTNDASFQDMLNSVRRLYMINTADAQTAKLISRRIQDLDSRKLLNNYTEIQQDGNKILIYVPTVMQMTYAIGLINSNEQTILVVFSDEDFYNLVERLRTE